MADRHILIVFATSHGQTEKIAHRIAAVLSDAGEHVTLCNADEGPREQALDEFDGIIVGAPVIYGRHHRSVRRFVRHHLHALRSVPTAFFSVSGSAASADPLAHIEAQRIVDAFLTESGWAPIEAALIAGTMAYTKYNPLVRWMVRRISAQEGGPTDTSRDHEFTDWTQVERFALRFAAELSAGALVTA